MVPVLLVHVGDVGAVVVRVVEAVGIGIIWALGVVGARRAAGVVRIVSQAVEIVVELVRALRRTSFVVVAAVEVPALHAARIEPVDLSVGVIVDRVRTLGL